MDMSKKKTEEWKHTEHMQKINIPGTAVKIRILFERNCTVIFTKSFATWK